MSEWPQEVDEEPTVTLHATGEAVRHDQLDAAEGVVVESEQTLAVDISLPVTGVAGLREFVTLRSPTIVESDLREVIADHLPDGYELTRVDTLELSASVDEWSTLAILAAHRANSPRSGTRSGRAEIACNVLAALRAFADHRPQLARLDIAAHEGVDGVDVSMLDGQGDDEGQDGEPGTHAATVAGP
jgi:hypothetical protein